MVRQRPEREYSNISRRCLSQTGGPRERRCKKKTTHLSHRCWTHLKNLTDLEIRRAIRENRDQPPRAARRAPLPRARCVANTLRNERCKRFGKPDQENMCSQHYNMRRRQEMEGDMEEVMMEEAGGVEEVGGVMEGGVGGEGEQGGEDEWDMVVPEVGAEVVVGDVGGEESSTVSLDPACHPECEDSSIRFRHWMDEKQISLDQTEESTDVDLKSADAQGSADVDFEECCCTRICRFGF
ncbi:uncharacterized protein LOC121424182 [Lytechinus variegatus]|uniref:uncharacterized protein LOC121424182 n=1 Tax=Lytechinus variegatus TaxID=7654 RepID=UPI001BB0D94E|nr:uncharacterized protein LOC121424182 [Lytechinus variegatus]